MIAGPLDRRVTLRRASVKTNDFGEDVETWGDLAIVWAARAEVSNRERFAAQEVGATLVARFRVRYSQRIHDLSPLDRIMVDGREHNITGVAEIGRREGFEITAAARAD
jgi:SPP1 family predicted phage head-tail adaptor